MSDTPPEPAATGRGCRACLVYDESLTGYDFGHAHPMNPIRVDLTVALARDLGVLDRLVRVDAPDASDDDLATVHDAALIEAVMAASADPTPDRPGPRARHRRRPDLRRDARGRPPRRRREHRGGPPGVDRRRRPRGQHRRRPAPRHARPGQRLLRLQRRRGGDPVAARPRRGAGRLRRRRRAPRRRRRAGLLRRPAGADDLAARDRPDALPRDRLPGRLRRSGGAGLRGQRRAAARHLRRRLAARVPRRGAAAARASSPRRCW